MALPPVPIKVILIVHLQDANRFRQCIEDPDEQLRVEDLVQCNINPCQKCQLREDRQDGDFEVVNCADVVYGIVEGQSSDPGGHAS